MNARAVRGASAALVVAALVLTAASPVGAECEARPASAKWCGGGTVTWGYGPGLSGAVGGSASTIRTQIGLMMNSLNAEFVAQKLSLAVSGPVSSGMQITFTYGQTDLGAWSCASTEPKYAWTYTHYLYASGDAMANLTDAQVDFNDQFSGWTGTLALMIGYHELGHALGLDHVYATGTNGCPVEGTTRPLMSEVLPCTTQAGLDALFWRGLQCLYGSGVSLRGVEFEVDFNGVTKVVRSSCSGTESCSSGGVSTDGAITYVLALSENGGPFTTFATLDEGDWIDNAYVPAFTQGYQAARVRMEVRDGETVLAAPISDAIDIPPPVTGVHPASASILLAARPNPSHGDVRLRLETPTAGLVRLSVIDVLGRRVRRLHAGRLEAGPQEFIWDGRDDSGRLAPPGVYYAEAFTPGARTTRPIVRLP